MSTMMPSQRSGQVLGTIHAAAQPVPRPRPKLTQKQKAAVIVRLLLAEGAPLELTRLPDEMQADLTEQIARMRRVDMDTLQDVAQDFIAELEGLGLSFPGGIDGALSLLDGYISNGAANRLRRQMGRDEGADPWQRLSRLELAKLLGVLEQESIEVGAVMLSKLPVPQSAELLSKLPGERARRIAYAMSLTGSVAPDTVARIGQSLISELDAQPLRAFEESPAERVGAILNYSAAMTREDVLQSLLEADASFAESVRKELFTFADIPSKLHPSDVPRVLRVLAQNILITALAAPSSAGDQAAAEFLLTNMSQRMATALREEMAEVGAIRAKDGEEAMNGVIAAIRECESAGEITLLREDD